MELYKEIQEIFPLIERTFSLEGLLQFRNTSVDELCMCHFGLGLWIRNNLLHPKSVLYDLFLENGIENRDDMSEHIIKLFHEYISRDDVTAGNSA